MSKLNEYKSWKGYKNAEDILPSTGDGISITQKMKVKATKSQPSSLTGQKFKSGSLRF